jgi:hypothetical protein
MHGGIPLATVGGGTAIFDTLCGLNGDPRWATSVASDVTCKKCRLSRHWAELIAPGTEAQRAETPSGSVHDGPTAESGDAQGPSHDH